MVLCTCEICGFTRATIEKREEATEMKAVFHVDELSKWGLTLTNAENMLQYYREHHQDCLLEIVANSQAVLALESVRARELGYFERLAVLAGRRVAIRACGNALRAQNISPDQLGPFAEVVPAGVVELAERQAEGYAYLKP